MATGNPEDADAGSLTERAYRVIRRRIVEFTLPPGSLVTENELIRELGLSKTPLRGALVLLRRDQFVTVQPRSGYRVAPITLRDARDQLRARSALEAEAGAIVAEHGRAAVRALDEFDAAVPDGSDPEAFLVADGAFHRGIVRAAGNAWLHSALDPLLDHLERLHRLVVRVTGRTEGVVHDHAALLDALQQGDAEGARRAVVEQNREIEKTAVEALLGADVVQRANLGEGMAASVLGAAMGATADDAGGSHLM